MKDPRQAFEYDPVSGDLTWKYRPREHFGTEKTWKAFITRCAGKSATIAHSAGYRQVQRGYSSTLAHRIIWEMHNGPIPSKMQVDHINGDRSDNRLENLRLATCSQNQHNRPKHPASPYKGVSLDKRRNRWYAKIQAYGVVYHLGSFGTAEAAHNAYCEAAKGVHGEFARMS